MRAFLCGGLSLIKARIFRNVACYVLTTSLAAGSIFVPAASARECDGVPSVEVEAHDFEHDWTLSQIVNDAPISPIFNTLYLSLGTSYGEALFRGCRGNFDLWGLQGSCEDGTCEYGFDGASAISRIPNFTWNGGNSVYQNFIPTPLPCPKDEREVSVIDMGGESGLYAFHAGASPYPRKVRKATYSFCDTVVIEKPSDVVLSYRVYISGSVFAAESFGDTNATFGKAKLFVKGSVGGETFDQHIEVESAAPIPDDDSFNIARFVHIPAGVTNLTIPVIINGGSELEVQAKGGSRNGILAGSATAGVSYPHSIKVSITGLDGATLPQNVRIYSQASGTVYADTRTFPGSPNFLVTAALRRDVQTNEIVADVTITNGGPGEARGVQIAGATLNEVAMTTAAQTIGRLIPELPLGRTTRTLRFPASSGVGGAGVVLKVQGVYQGGTFGGDIQVMLP
jgi:hypothetical protein